MHSQTRHAHPSVRGQQQLLRRGVSELPAPGSQAPFRGPTVTQAAVHSAPGPVCGTSCHGPEQTVRHPREINRRGRPSAAWVDF